MPRPQQQNYMLMGLPVAAHSLKELEKGLIRFSCYFLKYERIFRSLPCNSHLPFELQ